MHNYGIMPVMVKFFPEKRYVGSLNNPSSVAVKKGTVVVDHVPRKISTTFICQRGSISCRVTGSWYYSLDLPQGGLEIPVV